MPKARANNKVYSSTPSSGLIVEDEMICIARTASYVIRVEANSRRCQKHERRSTYTAVRAFLPVCFHHFSNYSSTPTYVVVVLSMGKANEEMYIYRRSCRSISLMFCLTVSFSCGIETERPTEQKSVYVIKRKMKKKVLCTYQAEVQFTRKTAYCIAAPRRNSEADSAAP